ncbi:elongation factor P [Mucilaginibacter flavus]|uniref:elongation factor P n=1 Tax=Mucilaginibacter flavus TaxID=931504 RepID=UPI0025B2CD6B|nr:elongation factor P [Mucilaginibacter flavus]MDN3584685.1 elongation factor P [Mucilaginibacter flavus]
MAKASEIKVGNILRYNGELVTVTEVLHRTPGKGGAFYLDKFRNIKTGKIVEARLATDEQVEICRVETNDYQYLYEDGDQMVIMDNTSYEQFNIPKALFGPSAKFLKEGMDVIVSFESEEPIMAQAPNSVELEITYAEPAVKGDTSSGAMKTATTEIGVEIKVPLFINQGDKIKVDTRTGEYLERAK